mmetsp:Transcript_52103/g.125815  ORF Transcript_52103/g.125815 Transcript_52103/m.125815 type:complete len:130 (-) Transcript_52103:655-1044(-)
MVVPEAVFLFPSLRVTKRMDGYVLLFWFVAFGNILVSLVCIVFWSAVYRRFIVLLLPLLLVCSSVFGDCLETWDGRESGDFMREMLESSSSTDVIIVLSGVIHLDGFCSIDGRKLISTAMVHLFIHSQK